MNRIRAVLVVVLTTVALLARASSPTQARKTAPTMTQHKGEADMDQRVQEFFLQFQKANSSSDTSAIGSLYSDNFMFAGPNGVQPVKKEDFLKVIPRMKAHFSSLGLSETQLQTVEATPLDAKYLLARVVWRMTLGSPADHRYISASATYILVRGPEDALSIILQVDHQDLATVIKNQ